MPIGKFVEYEDADADVRAVYDDIMATRGVDWINNFWKALAQDPATLKRTWESIKQVMAPGALDPLSKEMIYVAISVANVRVLHQLAYGRRPRQGDDRRGVGGTDGGDRHGQRGQCAGHRLAGGSRRQTAPRRAGRQVAMPIGNKVEYGDASPEVRAVYDDIMETRKLRWIANFWKVIAQDPATLKRTWESMKQTMGEGEIDPMIKELIFVAVSVANGCEYCSVAHTASARAKGATPQILAEAFAVMGMANETNALATAWQVEVDERLREAARGGKS
jgi:AhpD family alkylhydroperoxidase